MNPCPMWWVSQWCESWVFLYITFYRHTRDFRMWRKKRDQCPSHTHTHAHIDSIDDAGLRSWVVSSLCGVVVVRIMSYYFSELEIHSLRLRSVLRNHLIVNFLREFSIVSMRWWVCALCGEYRNADSHLKLPDFQTCQFLYIKTCYRHLHGLRTA